MKKNSAFSLIELMVVIAIVALLAAIAAPALVNNMNQARVMKAINTLNSFNTYLREEFDKGELASSPTTWSGFTFTDNTTTNVSSANFDNISYIQYFSPGGYLGANRWMVCAFVTGLIGAPSNSGGNAYNETTLNASRVCLETRFNASSGSAKTVCGLWNNGASGSPTDMSPELLPGSCNCLYLSNHSGTNC